MKLLAQIKRDLDFNLNLYNLVEVLKEISLSQYRSLEKKARSFDKFAVAIDDLLELVDTRDSAHPFMKSEGAQPAVAAVTSDAGLLGGLNLQIMGAAIKDAEAAGARLIVIGERGKAYASDSGLSYVSFGGIKDEQMYSQAAEFRDYIVKEAFGRRIGALKVYFPYPLSIMSVQIRTLQLLPFAKAAQVNARLPQEAPVEVIFESSQEDLAEYLVYLSLGHKFYEIFASSRLAELSARFVHLEDSKTKIEQLNRDLRLQYFRQRHELIDKNIRELFAARLAFR